ncbi:MAG TPA: phosphoribosylaminoimidazolesuccinocarboxamide synthase [Isosphaeraceae bacterium]|nr:phosphoribosylaminoimidazolesuccinocarboxamide synthase [Isosphaeraceae bacterium]
MALLETDLPGLPKRRGKVRDVYDLGDGRLLIVATDRLSAFDWVLPTPIPDKGRVLTGLSAFWFRALPGVPNHLLSTEIDDAGLDLDGDHRGDLVGRVMIVRKVRIIPFECVVRGYLSGSGWREYRETGRVCGLPLPTGLVESSPIPHPFGPLFTPATKAESGHDENVPFARMEQAIGAELAHTLRDRSVEVYQCGRTHSAEKGLLLADTKFEWGTDTGTGQVVLADEIFTPDSSRYWPADQYQPGGPQPSFDKQFVRDWLEASGWDKASPPPPLPEDIVARTREKYIQAYETLTEQPFPWK